MKHYPKCLYKTKEKTKVAKDEEHHQKLAGEGWKDIWTDEYPNQFVELVKKKHEEKKELLKELKEELAKGEAEVIEVAEEIEKNKGVKNGNRKNTTKGRSKAS